MINRHAAFDTRCSFQSLNKFSGRLSALSACLRSARAEVVLWCLEKPSPCMEDTGCLQAACGLSGVESDHHARAVPGTRSAIELPDNVAMLSG